MTDVARFMHLSRYIMLHESRCRYRFGDHMDTQIFLELDDPVLFGAVG